MSNHKYRAQRTEVDGVVFASRAESRRYRDLKLMIASGDISNLELQKRYPLNVNGQLICTYVSDFEYDQDGKHITEDVKGVRTIVFVIKKKLMRAIYGIDIQEVEV